MKIDQPISCAIRGRSDGDWHSSEHTQRLEIGGGISNSITSVSKDSYILEPCILRLQRTEEEKQRRHLYGDKGAKFKTGRQFEPVTDGCSNTITTFSKDNILMENKPKKNIRYRIRKLTSRECFRLMGLKDSEVDKIEAAGISESQRYKLAGNSIVVDTLVNGIYINLFLKDEKPEDCLF